MKYTVLVLSLMIAAMQANAAGVKNSHVVQEGYQAHAVGISPIAIGTNAQVIGGSSIAMGSNANVKGNGSTAIGMQSNITAQLSTAVGANAQALSGTSSAFGSSATASGYSSSAIGKGTEAKGLASFAGGNHAIAGGDGSVAIGSHANAEGGQATAIGANSKAEANQSAAFGSGASASERFGVALGYSSKASHRHGVALGSLSETDEPVRTKEATVNGYTYGEFAGGNPAGAVSVGGKAIKRTVIHIAAGRIDHTSTDAVNGSQLYAVAGQVGENGKNIRKHSQQIADLNDGLARLNAAKQQMDSRIKRVEKEARAGVAGAVAIANIPQAHQAGQFALGVGAGHFKGETAAAIGASYITKGGKLVLKGSAFADTGKRDRYGFGIGAAWTFGGRDLVKPAVQPVVVERVVQEVIVREVQPDNGKKVRG